MESLLPDRWFTGHQFCKPGRALAGATGAVYRVPVPHPVRTGFSVVVKFSRFGQEVGIAVDGDGMNGDTCMESAEFLPPFEEFGNLAKLQTSVRGRVCTEAPLAIYSPATRHLAWELGRKPHLQWLQSRGLRDDQARTAAASQITYDWERLYILLYQWLDGLDAEQCVRSGWISEEKMEAITRRTREVLQECGWVVLDHKPRHVILRPRPVGLLTRHGEPVTGLVDYELLQPAVAVRP